MTIAPAPSPTEIEQITAEAEAFLRTRSADFSVAGGHYQSLFKRMATLEDSLARCLEREKRLLWEFAQLKQLIGMSISLRREVHDEHLRKLEAAIHPPPSPPLS